jgi:hypothetical protein
MLPGLFSAPLDRRLLMKTAAGLAGGAVLSGSFAARAAGIVPPTAAPKGIAFDPMDPQANLDAYVRMTTTAEAGKTSLGWFKGRIFSVIGDSKIIEPLFDLEGFGASRAEKQSDGSYKKYARECGFYKDLRTGKILETWENPMLGGEKCEVMHINNDPVNSHLKAEFTLGFGATKDEYQKKIQFLMPWEFVGDDALAAFDVNLDWASPLDPAVWKRESPGKRVRVSEYQTWSFKAKELNDKSLAKIHNVGSWQRIATWLPWMLMGQKEGHLFYRSHTRSLKGPEELPKDIHDYAEKNFPEYFAAPTEWVVPNESSFEKYARTHKPKA